MQWATLQSGAFPELELLYAIPNGGHRNKATAGKLKAEGVKSGVPDLHLPIARGGYHSLYVEMKKPPEGGKGRLSPTQIWWRDRLIDEGHAVVTCHGATAGIEAIRVYLVTPEGIENGQRVLPGHYAGSGAPRRRSVAVKNSIGATTA